MDFLDFLVDFYVDCFPDKKGKEKEIKYALAGHYQYGTIDFDVDSRGIAYLVRFNIDKDVATILDFCIREDLRRKVNFRGIILKNWAKFPWVTKMGFVREMKYPEKKQKEYKIKEIVYGKH